MARKFLTPIDLGKLELQNAVIQNLATAPSSPVKGQIYFDTVENELFTWNGTVWNQATGISIGLLSARPAFGAANTGTFYYATDNFLMYYSNGTSWQQVNNFGSGLSTAASVTQTQADGTSTTYARADHSHAGPGFGNVTAQTTNGASSANGTAATVARSDHSHGTPALTSVTPTNTTTTSSTVGTGTAAAHEDHTHGLTPANFALSAFGAPTADVAWGGYKITGLATPTAGTDAANKNYVDGVAQGLDVKQSVRAATAAAGTLSTSFFNGQVIDTNVTLVTGDRILIKDQATAYENGIYTVNASGAPTRATDADSSAKVTTGMFVFVDVGTKNADTGWVLTTPDAIVLGTTALAFTQFSGAGTYTASNGVTLTGSNFVFTPLSTGGLQTGSTGASILLPSTSGLTTTASGLALNPTSTGGLTTSASGAYILLATNSGLGTSASGLAVGAGTGISVSTGTVAIDTTVVARKFSQTLSTSATTYTITHNLGTLDVLVQLYTVSDGSEVIVDNLRATTNTVTLTFAVAPTANIYRVVVIG
jgi:hypothetical protein